MEIVLAIVVASAVLLFGALISLGNERQKKVIDELREQVVLWAVQDLKIKREGLARSVKVEEPLVWLNKTASKVAGLELNLQVIEVTGEPATLVCHDRALNKHICFCRSSPNEIKKLSRFKRNRLRLQTDRRLLALNARHNAVYEISLLNGGILFDVELPLVWGALTGMKADLTERLWMYVIEG
ncbi:MAG: hypothetical protein QM730_14150 [Anaerolineales bacterium]